MKVWTRKRAANVLWLLALGSSLLVVACGGDDGVTPICPAVEDCVTPPGKPSADAGADGDESEADASDDESDE